MKKKKVFGYNPILILALIGLSASVYKDQLKHDSEKLTIINPNDTHYVSGSLVESSKEILVQKIYPDGQSTSIRDFLISMPTRVLIYMNDNWIRIVDNNANENILSYQEETDIVYINTANEYVLQSQFYELLGELLYNDLSKEQVKQVFKVYEVEGKLFGEEASNQLDYFKLCIDYFFDNNKTLQTYPQSYQMIEAILMIVGIL